MMGRTRIEKTRMKWGLRQRYRVLMWWWTLLCLTLWTLSRINQANAIPPPPPPPSSIQISSRYGIIIDAGSSGSRVNIYQWQHPIQHMTSHQDGESSPASSKQSPPATLVAIERVGTEYKVKPGISSFQDHVNDLPAYALHLIQYAKEHIPADAWASTPLYILATAGMRMVDPVKAQTLLDSLCSTLTAPFSQNPFILPGGCRKHIQIITGEREGIYGWLAANYMKHGLRPGDSSFGFMDMGGASTQIAFEPIPEMKQSHSNDLTSIRLQYQNGRIVQFDLFVTTWLEFGSNEAMKRHQLALVSDAPASTPPDGTKTAPADGPNPIRISDPCLQTGLEIPLNPLHSQDPSTPFMTGTGNFSACQQRLIPLLRKDKECPDTPCYFNGVHVPLRSFRNHRFLGVSEYYYSYHDLFGLHGVYQHDTFQRESSAWCARPWSQVQLDHAAGKFGTETPLDRVQHQCFKGAWLMTILHEGLGMPLEGASFEPVDDIDGRSISWTLGAMLYHVASPAPTTSRLLDGWWGGEEGGRMGAGFVLGMALMVMGVCVWRLLVSRRRGGGYAELLPIPSGVSPPKKRFDKLF